MNPATTDYGLPGVALTCASGCGARGPAVYRGLRGAEEMARALAEREGWVRVKPGYLCPACADFEPLERAQ